MKRKIKHKLDELNFRITRLSAVEKVIYSFLLIVLFTAVLVTVFKDHLWIFFLLSGVTFASGCYLFVLDIRNKQNNSSTSLDNNNKSQDKINIYTDGGNYNESIYGDYLEIQGNYVNINQDFSEVAAEISELINQLKNQGYTQEDAEKQVVTELAAQARKKHKVRKQLFKWRKSLGNATAKTSDETEAAREVVKSVSTYSYTSSTYFTDEVRGVYQKLGELLRRRKWKEADLETAQIIYVLSQKELEENSLDEDYLEDYFSQEYIAVLPSKDLNIINNLWLKYSNGRFGFSVQKSIWKSLGGKHKPGNFIFNSESEEKFGDIVGWRKEGNWLYFSDLSYSITAPPGHLPIRVMLDSDPSQRCSIDFSIFEVLVERIYKL
ncbi:MAG: GUN4 domain-containing protein [Nostocaceae cyanobacterium]|nr:GUN4 domain-containing protein [Nostocaceae cyanobacterium]